MYSDDARRWRRLDTPSQGALRVALLALNVLAWETADLNAFVPYDALEALREYLARPSPPDVATPCTACKGQEGIYECVCGCGVDGPGTIWGSNPYPADSHPCKAAKHAGAIPPGGGVFRLVFSPGASVLSGSRRHGIASRDHGAYSRCFNAYAVGDGPPFAACDPDPPCHAHRPPMEGVFWCPGASECGMYPLGVVWGRGPHYSADSCVCRAAAHAGVIGPDGGVFRVAVTAGRASYQGAVGMNGVTSRSCSAHGTSMEIHAVE